MLGILAIILLIVIYFIPTAIAGQRSHRNLNAITILNIFLGWTIVGWVVALIWSVYNEKK